MASKEVIDGIEASALECPVCMNRFTSPKILTCVHSFCLGCLEEWVKTSNGLLSCPTCREVCQIPEGGLQNLKNNIFISGMLDYVTSLEEKTASTCSLCSTAACFFCQECDELYCTFHRNDHTKMKMSKHHCIITMEEYTTISPAERLASKSVYCFEHNMSLHFYCDSCKIPVCVSCIQVEHPKNDGHDIINIKNAFEAFTVLSTTLIKEADERLVSFQDIAEQLQRKKTLEMSNCKKCEVKIKEEADNLIKLIEGYKKDQLQDLQSTHQHHLKLLNTHVKEVNLASSKISSIREITYTLMQSPNHAMALRSSSDISKRMDELLKQNSATDDMRAPNVLEYNNTILEALFKARGGVDTNPRPHVLKAKKKNEQR
ncbi:tripartite motif-containing protein 2-like [Antedon mediterranea]|uniref:tripartite motif-containing protein 2-like n=1 Tax=Antedon mediterranea TaxID=105859 RepID=UPI003AF5C40E